jgi:hypothetical protein
MKEKSACGDRRSHQTRASCSAAHHRSDNHRPDRNPVERTDGALSAPEPQRLRYVSWYSGPSPPSGSVSRPPLAVIAPHWTQLEAVTWTSTSAAPFSSWSSGIS